MSLQLLWEHPDLAQGELPAALEEFYGGGLGFEGPCVYANFVETLDGIVSIPTLERSNALVADESDDDKFLMGILRAFADVVLIGTGTLLASPKGRWRPEGVYPEGKDAFAALRAQLGKPERPAVAIVTSGRVARRHASGARRRRDGAHDRPTARRSSRATCRTSSP